MLSKLVQTYFVTVTAVSVLHECLLVRSPVVYAEWSLTLISRELALYPSSIHMFFVSLISIHSFVHSFIHSFMWS